MEQALRNPLRPIRCLSLGLLICLGAQSCDGDPSSDRGDTGVTTPDGGPSVDSDTPDALPTRVWSPPENISQSPTYSDLRINWGNSVAVDDSGAVHATWREVVDPQTSPLVSKIAHRRRGPSGWEPTQDLSGEAPGLGHPKLAVDAGHVYVVWHQYDPAPAGFDSLHLAVSAAGGIAGSFGSPATLVDDAPVVVSPAGDLSTSPSIAAVDDWVYVVWSDDRVVPTCGTNVPEVYLVRSSDRGGGWSTPQLVSAPDCRSSWTPAVAASDDFVHVAWTDDRHNTDDCALGSAACHEEEYYRRLADHGAAPDTPELRLTTDDPGPPVESWAGSVAVSAGAVHYAWMDLSGGDGWEVYYARSDDLGLGWSLPAEPLTHHAPGCGSVRPTLAAEGDVVHLVWFELCTDAAGDTATVFHRWSADGGDTWSNRSDVTSGNALFAVHPSVAVAPDAVHVVYNDQAEIWYATSPGP